MMQLYHYFRSSASYRVRIALNLKGLDYELSQIHLIKGGGEQLQAAFRAINPDGLVPALIDKKSDQNPEPQHTITQSLAIIEYLDETHPLPALLPNNAPDRAWVRSIALSIACDIHPLNNLRVLRYLTGNLKLAEEDKNAWYRHWCEQGLSALEQSLSRDPRTGSFCYGEQPGMADCFLVPQIYNAQRLQCKLDGLTTIMRINQACLELPAFSKATPENQPDAES
jgi:maleylacetoacetate isomerase